MSLGGDRFIQAPHTGDVVKISSLKEPYYAQEFAGGRRFDLSGGRGARAAAAALGGAEGGAATPSVDPAAARSAEEALLRDAAEVQRPGTLLFEAVRAQELPKLRVPSGALGRLDERDDRNDGEYDQRRSQRQRQQPLRQHGDRLVVAGVPGGRGRLVVALAGSSPPPLGIVRLSAGLNST